MILPPRTLLSMMTYEIDSECSKFHRVKLSPIWGTNRANHTRTP
jgi:hypothetical protein